MAGTPGPRVEIELTTFEAELGEVALVPGAGGIFEIRADKSVLWSRHERGRFPDVKELKPTAERVF